MLRTWALRFVLAGILTHAAAYPTQAASSFHSGSGLLERCESKDPSLLGMCLGFTVGVADSFDCQRILLSGYRWQSPRDVTAGQVQKVVVKYLNENPEELHLAAGSLVAAALSKAFPCP